MKIKLWVWAVSLGITYPLGRNCLQPNYNDRKLRSEKTVIVTGASGNLGRAITSQLALRKVRVIMACKDMDKCKAIRRELVMLTNYKGIVCRHLDLEDIDSINKFVDNIVKTEPHLDVLINNAAVKGIKNKEMTKYGIEKNYFVNFLAPYLLTFRLLDKMKETSEITRDARIINVIGTPKKSWDVDLRDINFDTRKYSAKTAHTQSKMALAYFTILLDDYLKREKQLISVMATSPIFKNLTESLYRPSGLVEGIVNFIDIFMSADCYRASAATVRCAIDPKIQSGKLYTYFGTYFGWGKAKDDNDKAKAVWNAAAQMLLNIKEDPKVVKPKLVVEDVKKGVDKDVR